MNFELWLFTIKRLAQTMDAAKLIYEGLSDDEKRELQEEYEIYINGGKKPSSKKIVQTAGKERFGDLSPEFAHFNDDVLWGENWNNTDIDLKTRSIITVVALVSKGITGDQLKNHITAAKDNGVSKKEMAAVITHTAFYAGWPAAWDALEKVKEIYG